MNNDRKRGTLALVALAVALTAHARADAGEPRTVQVEPWAVAQGKGLFAQCAPCHGQSAEGRVGFAPSLASKSFLETATDDMLIRTIKKGRPGTTMISWESSLNDGQVRSIVAYLRSLTPTEPAALDESPLRGDADRGGKVFSDICRMCHGNTGAGYQESVSGTGIGRKVFLDEVSDGYLRRIIRRGKSGTPMRAFSTKTVTAVANLTDQEIEDVIAFLRRSAW